MGAPFSTPFFSSCIPVALPTWMWAVFICRPVELLCWSQVTMTGCVWGMPLRGSTCPPGNFETLVCLRCAMPSGGLLRTGTFDILYPVFIPDDSKCSLGQMFKCKWGIVLVGLVARQILVSSNICFGNKSEWDQGVHFESQLCIKCRWHCFDSNQKITTVKNSKSNLVLILFLCYLFIFFVPPRWIQKQSGVRGGQDEAELQTGDADRRLLRHVRSHPTGHPGVSPAAQEILISG